MARVPRAAWSGGPDAYDLADPFAPAMIESLRAFGYNLPTAIADLLDNSITAGARSIWLNFFWDGADSYLTICDDGRGMTRRELFDAMRPGSRNALEVREQGDLGRFGLGLKTASFSQCRRLTVKSKVKYGRASTRCWDLDYVNLTGEWRLLSGIPPTSEERLQELNEQEAGTIVLWECMDRVVGNASSDDDREHDRFLELVDEAKAHIAMTFHRYLSGSRPLRIYLNGRKEANRVRAWDPYLEDEITTQHLQEERLLLRGQEIIIRPFVLPHHDKITQRVHAMAAGPAGWNDQQGFYVYRNRRLLVAGDWLGLGFAKEEHHKLARISVDLPNTMDGDWKIDVKKSRAWPPSSLRGDFKRIAKLSRRQAEDVYRRRGIREARKGSEPHVYAWRTARRGDKVFYEVNRDHPLVSRALEVPRDYRPVVQALLRLLEETVPVQQIWIDAAREPESQRRPFEKVAENDVAEVMAQVYRALRRGGMARDAALRKLSAMEAFADFPHLVASLPDKTS
jgi:Histidine kinase-, DNA gyrase B-, and HSP90-like ATPase